MIFRLFSMLILRKGRFLQEQERSLNNAFRITYRVTGWIMVWSILKSVTMTNGKAEASQPESVGCSIGSGAKPLCRSRVMSIAVWALNEDKDA